MNWEAIGAIGEVLGAIGVIATLLYLAIQIHQNTKAIRGATLDSITERKQFELNWSSEIAPAWRKVINDPHSLTDDESWQVLEWMTAALTARQNEFFQYKHGLIDQEIWEASEKIIQVCLGTEWGRNWWKEYAPSLFTNPFIEIVNETLAKSDPDYAEILDGMERK